MVLYSLRRVFRLPVGEDANVFLAIDDKLMLFVTYVLERFFTCLGFKELADELGADICFWDRLVE